ncbi:MAG TPA: hypothetical protein VJX72_05745, partial [Candidatus Acidoferrum sp.]|nr:hypothetical protein [Candidatus Acidoferrum sp.]
VPGYPNGRILSPTEGPGFLIAYTPSNPGAGADLTYAVPTNTRWRIQSFGGNFIASAAVANRYIKIGFNSSVGYLWLGEALIAVTASQNILLYAAAIQPYTAAEASRFFIPLPPGIFLLQSAGLAMTVSTLTGSIQAGDTWSGFSLLVEEWLDNV